MTINRNEILSGGVQDRNAGNAGDLGKHTCYLSLLAALQEVEPWCRTLHIVERTLAKGCTFPRTSTGSHSVTPPTRNGTLFFLPSGPSWVPNPPDSVQSRGSLRERCLMPARHCFTPVALKAVPHRSIVCYDHDANVRQTLRRILQEPSFAIIARDITVIDVPVGGHSEPLTLAALRADLYGKSHLLHLDPFAFVMGDGDQPMRDGYRALVQECDSRVADGTLGAASVFVTWGSNSRAALDDQDGAGYNAGLPGGYRDLLHQVDPRRRVVVEWCWTYYYSQLLIVHESVREALIGRLGADLGDLGQHCSRLRIS